MFVKKILSKMLISARHAGRASAGFVKYCADLVSFLSKQGTIPLRGLVPMCSEWYGTNGVDGHYTLQDMYVAKKIIEAQPEKHFDIGSRVDGFITHLLCAWERDVTVIDIRPLPLEVGNLHFIQADATNLEGIEDNSIESLSSLHAVEHFGLGRYGDKIDPTACFTAMKSLQRVLQKNGRLYFSVPIGKEDGVYFNVYRIFHPLTILKAFDELTLIEFSYIHDLKIHTFQGNEARRLIENNQIPISHYDCGIFIFCKE